MSTKQQVSDTDLQSAYALSAFYPLVSQGCKDDWIIYIRVHIVFQKKGKKKEKNRIARCTTKKKKNKPNNKQTFVLKGQCD